MGRVAVWPWRSIESFHAHPTLVDFLDGSSLEGIDPSLSYRVDYMGVSDTRQPATRKKEELGRAWRFEAMIDKGLIDAQA